MAQQPLRSSGLAQACPLILSAPSRIKHACRNIGVRDLKTTLRWSTSILNQPVEHRQWKALNGVNQLRLPEVHALRGRWCHDIDMTIRCGWVRIDRLQHRITY